MEIKNPRLVLGIVFTILGVIFVIAGIMQLSSPSEAPSIPMLVSGIALCVVGIGLIISGYMKRKYLPKDDIRKTVDLRNVLTGMGQAQGKVDLQYVAKHLGMDVKALEFKIYDLIGAGKLAGKVENFIFTPSGDISASIDALLGEFESWKGGKV